ncbi:nucleobase:cation symporter-2 family protein [Oceanispirochaeta sp.]|jgi:xanthine permease XanP|uniref:nucleobase:cation symporter-2 family protein n=1 Tax=Oceanispirochaeta sp. TaxID=2035350 RepID=UPI00261CC013|nr:nucleobase:cation symporter-2 family protein [Oceanispirochaeta sp.]MDA3957264.1 nucleobase:cation symporter-2 family protein [Oceanispirochaeta sp.]
MSDATKIKVDLIYGLTDRPKAGPAFFAALQHMMAIFIGIVTPAIVISGVLGLSTGMSAYLVSMSLFVSGMATFIQCRKIGPIGSGLLSIQGTSFTFLSVCIAIGFSVKSAGGTEAQMVAAIFGTALIASPVEMIFSRFIPFLKKIITPLVSGIVVTLIGMSLIKVGITDIGGGAWLLGNKPEFFASPQNLMLAAIVLVTIIAFNRSSNKWLRMGAIVFGLIAGYIVAAILGIIQFDKVSSLSIVALPIPFKYGFAISWAHVIPMALLFLITTVESIGDLTATSMVSGEPVEGDLYMKRISGGVLGDGINSALAAVFNTFPNTTFSQNNGVIQMTGVASRYIGFWISGLLVIFGLFPIVGGLFSIIPNAVLGGATIIMFGTVAASGIRIIASSIIDRRGVIIMAISFGLGMGVTFVPEILQNFSPFMKSVFGSAITTGGLTAIFLNIVLPRSYKKQPVTDPMKDMV